ncbi:hypothetical protein CK203_049773 [Vitis vinifera]|uniref:Uncharacterized protein n=1 Tax=Vitis vinifera TaxID=29760 RepID=A0A438H2A0_VITVI|nr:hypothetical protein CK203_049773 [Vitis vinifera]
MCGGDDPHMEAPRLLGGVQRVAYHRRLVPIELPLYSVLSNVFVFIGVFLVPNLDSPSWTRVRGRLTRALDQPDQRVDQRDIAVANLDSPS